jgi:hypothetical protein
LADLNLDQVIASATAGKDEYDLKPFYYLPLQDVDDVAFRHEVMRDLEHRALLDGVKAFAESLPARDILQNAPPRSIVVLNEIFTSTTFRDATLLSRK